MPASAVPIETLTERITPHRHWRAAIRTLLCLSSSSQRALKKMRARVVPASLSRDSNVSMSKPGAKKAPRLTPQDPPRCCGFLSAMRPSVRSDNARWDGTALRARCSSSSTVYPGACCSSPWWCSPARNEASLIGSPVPPGRENGRVRISPSKPKRAPGALASAPPPTVHSSAGFTAAGSSGKYRARIDSSSAVSRVGSGAGRGSGAGVVSGMRRSTPGQPCDGADDDVASKVPGAPA